MISTKELMDGFFEIQDGIIAGAQDLPGQALTLHDPGKVQIHHTVLREILRRTSGRSRDGFEQHEVEPAQALCKARGKPVRRDGPVGGNILVVLTHAPGQPHRDLAGGQHAGKAVDAVGRSHAGLHGEEQLGHLMHPENGKPVRGGVVEAQRVLQVAHLVGKLSATRHDDHRACRLGDKRQYAMQAPRLRQRAANLDDDRRCVLQRALSHGRIHARQLWWRDE